MENLIKVINELQICIKKFNIRDIHIPSVIVIGSQSSGKSSVLERIIDCDILPKDSHLATNCPIILQLINDKNSQDIRCVFEDESEEIGLDNIQRKLQELTNKVKENKVIDETPIIVTIYGTNIPSLTLIDLPGIIRNIGNLPNGSIEAIQRLNEKYASSVDSIILAISSANVDLANSDSIQISRKYDPNGERTINVITKIDIMDAGTNARDILKENFVQNALGTILLRNRSQMEIENKTTMAELKEREADYLNSEYPDIAMNHGIDRLVEKIIKKLNSEIKNNLPKIMKEIGSRKDYLADKVEDFKKYSDKQNVTRNILEFTTEYSKLIHGDKLDYPNQLVGGAKISELVYEKFQNDIENLKVDDVTEEEYFNLLKNTTGNKKFAYSVEKAFFILIERECEKFWQPILGTIEEVTDCLRLFVNETIEELHLSDNRNMKVWVQENMKTLIDARNEHVKSVTKSILECEKNRLYCPQPNSNWFETISEANPKKVIKPLKHSSNKSQHAKDEQVTKEMVKSYFRTTQDSIIYNTPKWIQKFLVEDLLVHMKELICVSDIEFTNILKIDSETYTKNVSYQEELGDLERIENKMKKIRTDLDRSENSIWF